MWLRFRNSTAGLLALATALVTLALAGVASAQAPAAPATGSVSDSSAPEKKAEPTLKVFPLKNVGAQEIITAHAMRGPLAGGQVRMVRLAQDERGKTLFARGTAEELAQIDELVKALDVAPDKLSKCEVAGLYLIPLQRAEARSVASLLTQLGFRAGVLQIGKRHAIAIMDPDARKDIEAIVASEEASAAEKSEAQAK